MEADPEGDEYCFERGACEGQRGRCGWADVWKRGHFAWEYKSQGKDLDAAFQQLRQYALALENPPLLIVSDMRRLPDSHELDEQRQHGPRVHDLRPRRSPDIAKQAQVGVQRPGTVAAGADAAGADGAGGGHICRTGAGVAGRRARATGRGALRQPAGVLHVRRGRGVAAGPDVPADAGSGAPATRSGSPGWRAGNSVGGHA